MKLNEHKKSGSKIAQSRDDRLKAALKSNMAKRKEQARRKSDVRVQSVTSDEVADSSKD